jgi:hypothetical protein
MRPDVESDPPVEQHRQVQPGLEPACIEFAAHGPGRGIATSESQVALQPVRTRLPFQGQSQPAAQQGPGLPAPCDRTDVLAIHPHRARPAAPHRPRQRARIEGKRQIPSRLGQPPGEAGGKQQAEGDQVGGKHQRAGPGDLLRALRHHERPFAGSMRSWALTRPGSLPRSMLRLTTRRPWRLSRAASQPTRAV